MDAIKPYNRAVKTAKERIDLVLRERDWTITDWADATHGTVNRRTLGTLRDGSRGKRTAESTWRDLARAAGVSLAWLRDGVEPMGPYVPEGARVQVDVDDPRYRTRAEVRHYASQKRFADRYLKEDLDALDRVVLGPKDAGDAPWWLARLEGLCAVRALVEASATRVQPRAVPGPHKPEEQAPPQTDRDKAIFDHPVPRAGSGRRAQVAPERKAKP